MTTSRPIVINISVLEDIFDRLGDIIVSGDYLLTMTTTMSQPLLLEHRDLVITEFNDGLMFRLGGQAPHKRRLKIHHTSEVYDDALEIHINSSPTGLENCLIVGFKTLVLDGLLTHLFNSCDLESSNSFFDLDTEY